MTKQLPNMMSVSVPGGAPRRAGWVLYGVGDIATVVVTVFVARIARAAIDKKAAIE